jgi:hypothetical protein
MAGARLFAEPMFLKAQDRLKKKLLNWFFFRRNEKTKRSKAMLAYLQKNAV